MVTGVRPETFENLQLNAGAFLVGFDWTSATTVAALKTAVIAALKDNTRTLGATRGGGTFTLTPEVRQIEADGKRYEFVGSTVFDSWTVMMSGTLLEVTPGNFERILPTAEASKTGEVTTLKVRTSVQAEDYLESVVWVGDTSKGFVLIELENALNTTGATLTFTDKGEGTLPFEFHAHQSTVEDYDYAPVRIVFFDEAA